MNRLPYQILRALWYVVAEATVVLIVATFSRRLIFAEQAWSLMVTGIALGLFLALVGWLLGRSKFYIRPGAVPIPVVLLAVAIGICALLGFAVPHLKLGLVGSVVMGSLGGAVSLVLYLVFDAPEASPHA